MSGSDLKKLTRPEPLLVGQMLYGFCGGYFGRDSYEDKRVEAVGVDWVVARDNRGEVQFAQGVETLDFLLTCTNPEPT